jgi:hypothetical protein
MRCTREAQDKRKHLRSSSLDTYNMWKRPTCSELQALAGVQRERRPVHDNVNIVEASFEPSRGEGGEGGEVERCL